MRVEIKRLEAALAARFSRDEAIRGRLHPGGAARDDDRARAFCDGCSAECAAAGSA
jgi:hypothetical protein